MHVQARRELGHLEAELAQALGRQRRIAALILERGGAQAAPGALEPVDLVRPVAARGLVRRLELLDEGVVQCLRLARLDHALALQRLGVGLPHRRVLGDALVHQRLGEGRLVALIVTVAAVAPEVDHDVDLELLAELGREPCDARHRHRVVAVDVEDRALHAASDVGGVGRAARVGRAGGEADLVVDDEVDGAADLEALEVHHLQAFVDHALADERGVAVHQDADHAGALGVALLRLLRAHLAHDHRVHRLEVRGVGGKREVDLAAVGQHAVGRGAEMVLDVARAQHVVDSPPPPWNSDRIAA